MQYPYLRRTVHNKCSQQPFLKIRSTETCLTGGNVRLFKADIYTREGIVCM